MKKQTIFLMVASLILVFFVVFFSFYQAAKVQRESELAPVSLQKERQAPATQQQRQLVPARPQDYGMTEIQPGEGPKTQEEWDMFFAQEIKRLKANTPPETWSKVQAKVQEKPKETQDAMIRLEELMKKYTEELKKDPQDKELQEKLQRLMMLKSIQKELPDK